MNDTNVLQAMLECIEMYKEGSSSLSKLIDGLIAGYYSLFALDQTAREAFVAYWGRLEQVNATMISEGRNLLSVEKVVIEDSLSHLTIILKDQLSINSDAQNRL